MEALIVNESESLNSLLSHIVVNYLVQLYCICVLSSSLDEAVNANWNEMKSPQTDNYQQIIFLKHENTFPENLSNIDDLVRSGIENNCQAFIVTHTTVIDFLDSFENVRFTTDARFFLMHVIALPTTRDNTEEYIDRILNHPTVHDLPNMLVIASLDGKKNYGKEPDGSDTFDLVTSEFVGLGGSSNRRLLDTFDGNSKTFSQNANLFPLKFGNLQGRIMRIALFNYLPYATWTEVPPGEGNANALDTDEEKTLLIDGTETLMTIVFCEIYNCTLAVSLDEEGEWGIIWENATGNGVIGAIAERRADVGFSALYLWQHEFQFLDFSSAITRSGITCICPKPRLLSGWLLPTEPFTPTMWMAEFFSFLSIVATIALIRIAMRKIKSIHVGDIKGTWLQTLAIFILQCTKFGTHHLPEMIIASFALLTCLIVANAYVGGFASIMTVPRFDAPIDTAHQLAERNLEWGATHDAWIFSILDATQPDLKKLVGMFQAIPFEALAARRSTRDFCFSVERLPYGHYAVGEYIDEEALNYLQIMRTDLYYEYCVAMSYKTWPFKEVFDLLVLHVAESGIQKYWELQSVANHANSKIQLGISISRQREKTGPISLGLDHVSGAFILWGIGLFFGTMVLFVEKVCDKYGRMLEKRKIDDFLRYN